MSAPSPRGPHDSRAGRQAVVITAWVLFYGLFVCLRPVCACGQDQGSPLYRRAGAPVEERIDDLMGRMTVAEKVRQLDMYSGAKDLMSRRLDATHAAPDAVLLPEKAQQLWGDLGVGSIHDLYPTPAQANQIQKWVMAHDRLGIPALFIEEGLHGYNTGTVFPAPIGLQPPGPHWSRGRPPQRLRLKHAHREWI